MTLVSLPSVHQIRSIVTCLSDELAAVLVLLSPAGAALLADEPQPTSVAPAIHAAITNAIVFFICVFLLLCFYCACLSSTFVVYIL